MKIGSFLFAAALSVAVLSPSAFAIVPVGSDTSPLNFLGVADGGWHTLHFGGYASAGERGLEQNGRDIDVDVKRFSAFFGYDIFRWATPYVTLGIMDCEPDYGIAASQSEKKFMYGAGLWLNIYDTDEYDFLTLTTRYRFLANIEYIKADFDDYDWSEVNASVVFELHNEIGGGAEMFIDEIGVYAGPCVSHVRSDTFDMRDNTDFGATAGLSLSFSRRTYFTVGGDFFRSGSLAFGSVGIRF